MKSHWQSVGKEAPVYTDNEDACRADDGRGIWAVADGAGGTGIYAGEWAQHLVFEVPVTPFNAFEALGDWLNNHWETFFNAYGEEAKNDYLINHKWISEGSGATLATLHYGQERFHWSLYGDAVVLCFSAATNQLRASNPDVRQFETPPYLLNWLTSPDGVGFASGTWPHQPGQQYALLSDALGQYLLMAYAVLNGDAHPVQLLAQQSTAFGFRAQTHLDHWSGQTASFHEAVWEPLRSALASAELFLTYTQQLRTQHLLGPDDYTCLFIED